LEDWLDVHPVFREGPRVSAVGELWTEFQACLQFGIDPDAQFKKDKYSRMLITGGIVANGAINNMRNYDMAKERERKAELQGKRK
jgi:hypothetical protein